MDLATLLRATPRRRVRAQRVVVGLLTTVLAVSAPLVATPAHAVPAITVSVGAPVSGAAGAPVPITSVQVAGSGTTPVQLRVTHGTLSMTTTAGLTFTGASSGAALQFSGAVADLNAALATLRYTRAGVGTDTLEVALIGPGEVYWPTNGHLYARVTGPYDWPTSNTAANASTRAGAQGYLATFTSSAEETFVIDRLGVSGWIGGIDAGVEGTWVWSGGPEAGQQFWQGTAGGTVTGYAHWHPVEPNAFNGFEDCAVLYTDRLWNDSACSAWGYGGYYAEYGAPGALPDLAVATLGVTTATSQSIGFTGPTGATYGTPVPLSAIASSGLPVAFASTTPSVCTVTGSTVDAVVAGSCTIEATQAGDATYAAAAPVGQTFTIAKAGQAIAVSAPGALAVGDDGALAATAPSGLPVSFASTTPAVCSTAGGVVRGLAVGTCTVTASVAGDARYEPGSTPVTVAVGASVPGAPTDVSAKPGEASVTLRFAPPTSDGGAAVTGYRVTVSPGGQVVDTTSSPVTVGGLQPGAPVTFTVRATNAAGAGPGTTVVGHPGDVDQGFLGGGHLIGGGTNDRAPVPDHAVGAARAATGSWVALADGRVLPVGGAPDLGGVVAPTSPIVDIAATRAGDGYWLTDARGAVSAFGAAVDLGGVAASPLSAPIAAIAPAPVGVGYWLVAADGGVFAFGSASFAGSTAALPLRAPIVGMVPMPSSAGYWLVAGDGGVFAFGDATFLGAAAHLPLQAPIVAIVATPTRAGYYLVAADGGVFTFGDAVFHGSAADHPGAPVVGLRLADDGYDLVHANGTITPLVAA